MREHENSRIAFRMDREKELERVWEQCRGPFKAALTDTHVFDRKKFMELYT